MRSVGTWRPVAAVRKGCGSLCAVIAWWPGPDVEAALAASGRGLLVVDPAEVDDDLVREVTEILTSLCARRYGRRAAANRAARAVAAVTSTDGPA